MRAPSESSTEPGALPTFLIVGAAKCGTTSLHRYLGLHPEIDMSARKELKLFSRADWRDYLLWYRRQFSASFAVRGESSPAYSMHPYFPDVPSRIAMTIPRARLIYVVRDPIERLLAHYVEDYALSRENRPLSRVLADLESPTNNFVMTSRYSVQLDRYREFFAEDRILVIDQADLLTDRTTTLKEVFGFLRVDPEFRSPEFDRLHNQRHSKLRVNRGGEWLHRRGLLTLGQTLSCRMPPSLRNRAKLLVAAPVETPALDAPSRAALVNLFAEDTARLREDTGRRFTHWSV